MHSAAVKQNERLVFQQLGEVVACREGGLVVRTSFTELTARRAVSCLLAPRVGDRVLIVAEEEGDSFVLAVLERPGETGAAIEVEGDLQLRSESGQVTIAAREGVALVTPETLRMTATELDASVVRAKVSSQQLELFSASLKAEMGAARCVAGKVDMMCERISQKVRRSYRTVADLDQVRAGHMDYKADGNARLHGENALVTARDLVKLNADQVHIS